MVRKFFLLFSALLFSGYLFSQATGSKYVLLAWDVSFSMQNRELESDFKFLDNYFKRNRDLRVNLVLFANEVIENLEYQVVGGQWETLQEKLKNVVYDGATNYKSVENQISLEHNELLLFTDGAQTFGTGIPSFGIKTLIINSNPYKEQNDLNALLVASKGRLFDYGRPLFSDTASQIQSAKENDVATTSGAPQKDSVATGMGIRLEEVVVSEKRPVENPVESVNIGNGEVDKNRVGVAVQSIGDEQISPITTDVSQAIQGKFSGVQLGREEDISKVTIRSQNSMQLNNYGLVVIDGVPQEQANSSKGNSSPQPGFGFVDPENIADITVLKGMAATTRFGSLGANGVILITTKSAKFKKPGEKPVDRARLTNNVYEGDLSSGKNIPEPSYINELKGTNDVMVAYTLYLKQRMDYLASPTYFINVFEQFKLRDAVLAQRILSNIAELNAKNVPLLRILAYAYDANGEFANAFKINEQILELDERSAQAKLDLALSAEDNKKYQLAYAQLSELALNSNPIEIDFSGLNKPVTNEFHGLLNTEGANITVSESDKKYANPLRFDARILVMWSKSNAEFELQIINPDKRFFTWEHSEVGNPTEYFEGIKNDVNTEEFELIGAQKGDWYLKVNDLAEYVTVDPVYLKCIVYYNFGKADQRKEVQILELLPEGKSPSLFKVHL
ncbi:MAG: TonB-dependent receptor plug domain-containing protein [Maribacter sp.]|nr:TonB-dependent receptor plug domain-containing protein [Maribacter sp.]